ncbi:hypothetical protein Tco_0456660 [Tanacetum coccineum]
MKLKKECCEVLNEYNEAMKEEEKFLYQKTRVEWLKEGKNTAFFHKVLKGRKHKGRIMSICDEKCKSNMINEVSDEEIKDALFDIEDDKASGPDGKLLGEIGFHKVMVNWIMVTINVNGERIEYLSEGRRLRQGDPVSPYLFTLVMEVLNLLLKKNIKESGSFKYQFGCKSEPLSQVLSKRDVYDARMADDCTMAEAMERVVWKWPSEWFSRYNVLNNIIVDDLYNERKDKVWWVTNASKKILFLNAWKDICEDEQKVEWRSTVCLRIRGDVELTMAAIGESTSSAQVSCPPRCGKCQMFGHQEGECRTRIPVAGELIRYQNVTCLVVGNMVSHLRSDCPEWSGAKLDESVTESIIGDSDFLKLNETTHWYISFATDFEVLSTLEHKIEFEMGPLYEELIDNGTASTDGFEFSDCYCHGKEKRSDIGSEWQWGKPSRANQGRRRKGGVEVVATTETKVCLNFANVMIQLPQIIHLSSFRAGREKGQMGLFNTGNFVQPEWVECVMDCLLSMTGQGLRNAPEEHVCCAEGGVSSSYIDLGEGYSKVPTVYFAKNNVKKDDASYACRCAHTCYRAEEGEELDQIVTKNSQGLSVGGVRSMTFSHDGKYVLSSTLGERYVDVWEVAGRKKKSACCVLAMDYPDICIDSR